MLGTRAIWHKGWKAATAVPAAPESWGDFHQQKWELFHTDADPSECTDLAGRTPREAAGVDRAVVDGSRTAPGAPPRVTRGDRDPRDGTAAARQADEPVHLFPGRRGSECVAPNIRNRSYTLAAEVEIDDPGTAGGVLISQGSRFGGHALYVKDGKLKYAYNFVGELVQVVEVRGDGCRAATSCSPPRSRRPATGCRRREPSRCTCGTRRSARGRSARSRASSAWAAAASSSAAPAPSRSPTTTRARGRGAFTGGTITGVVIDVSGDAFIDLAQGAAAAFARQ